MAEDIAQWLNRFGLGQYAQAFADNDIGVDVLSDLSDSDLRRIPWRPQAAVPRRV